MTVQKKKERWIEFAWSTAGCFLFAFGVNIIITPLGLYNGGFMGIAQLIRTVLFQVFDFSFLKQIDIAGIVYYIINRTYLFAFAAIYTFFIVGGRIKKTLLILFHFDTFCRAYMHTRRTTATLFFVNHRFNFPIMPSNIFFSSRLQLKAITDTQYTTLKANMLTKYTTILSKCTNRIKRIAVIIGIAIPFKVLNISFQKYFIFIFKAL